ncbi:ANTAR domain-containing protein [Kitasatospora arboriphila]|uniref:ANTAR domain-containing protein n=1 Tax=Kitasatospora arboriphila TaxID=258052 RepID=UPI003CD0C32B
MTRRPRVHLKGAWGHLPAEGRGRTAQLGCGPPRTPRPARPARAGRARPPGYAGSVAGRAEHHPAAPPGPEPDDGAGADERSVLQATVDRLRAEVEGLQTAMRTRAVIEQAKGMLAEREGGTPDQAFDRLVQLSQDTNRKLVEIAAEVVGVAAPIKDRTAGPGRPGPAGAGGGGGGAVAEGAGVAGAGVGCPPGAVMLPFSDTRFGFTVASPDRSM